MKISDLKYLLLILLLFPAISAFSQGYLMLAGGGAESSGGWSDAPYRWVVEHAANKRIAVVGYDAGASEWIPNYFKGFGAKAAKNIIISSRSGADMQSLYDTLITYDGVFIKGGDQGQYYSYYKGTKTQAALQFIYDKGGVLSGTSAGTAILSPVVYTAVIASVDPATALQNAYSAQITLANDFVNTLPKKYIVDTHFHERGRFGRLPAFMATWFRKTKEIVIGIGVDDHTALCIDADGKASVYGTGAVGFYHNMNATAPYDTTISMLRAGNMNFSQLIHGCTIDLKTGFISGLGNTVQPRVGGENNRLTLLMSGTDYPSEEAYNYFIHQAGAKDDAILIVTGLQHPKVAVPTAPPKKPHGQRCNPLPEPYPYQSPANPPARAFFGGARLLAARPAWGPRSRPGHLPLQPSPALQCSPQPAAPRGRASADRSGQDSCSPPHRADRVCAQ